MIVALNDRLVDIYNTLPRPTLLKYRFFLIERILFLRRKYHKHILIMTAFPSGQKWDNLRRIYKYFR